MTAGFDIIGDVHGHAELLRVLLEKMGYQLLRGAWRHPEGRRAVFAGDLIDRGPLQSESLAIVRSMAEAGSALCVLGNHEYNAILHFLGRRGLSARDPHVSFLDEMARSSPEYRSALRWLVHLPLWLDLDGIRVVHACWDPAAIARLEDSGLCEGGCCSLGLCLKATEKGRRPGIPSEAQRLSEALDQILKGPEIPLPLQKSGEPFCFKDNEGRLRDKIRVQWWREEARSFRDAAFLPERNGMPRAPLPQSIFVCNPEKPTFIGHYWLRERDGVAPLTAKLACLDYSAGRGGPLAAYRWNEGEETLSEDQFVLAHPDEAPAQGHPDDDWDFLR